MHHFVSPAMLQLALRLACTAHVQLHGNQGAQWSRQAVVHFVISMFRRAPSVSTTAEGGSKYWWGSRHGAPISPRAAKRTIQLWQVPLHDAKTSAVWVGIGWGT